MTVRKGKKRKEKKGIEVSHQILGVPFFETSEKQNRAVKYVIFSLFCTINCSISYHFYLSKQGMIFSFVNFLMGSLLPTEAPSAFAIDPIDQIVIHKIPGTKK